MSTTGSTRPATTTRSGSIPAAAARIWRSMRNTLTHEISSVGFARGDRQPGCTAQGAEARHEPAPHRTPAVGSTACAPSASPSTAPHYTGHAGDTLASALLANGVTLFGRSFKYHRPRGVLSAGVDEPNALVTVLRGEVREPNIPATMVEIYDGLTVVSQNRFPSLGLDVGARQPARRQDPRRPASTTRPSWGR